MFCQKCGAKLNDGDAFCSSCGAKVEAAETTASTPTSAPVSGEKANVLGLLAGLAPQALVTLAGLVVGIISCFLPYKSYSQSGFIGTMGGDITSTDKILLQDGGVAIILFAALTGFFVFKKKRLPYRIFAIITGFMCFMFYATAGEGTGARYSEGYPLFGSKVVLVAAILILAGVIMDFVRGKKTN